MFASLKSKIKEETGSDLKTNMGPHRLSQLSLRTRSRLSSTISVNSDCESESQQQQNVEQLPARHQNQTYALKVSELSAQVAELEKRNGSLLESLKLAQTQSEQYCEEQSKIQELQEEELRKLKSLLSFREQESLDRIGTMRQYELKIDQLTAELERVKKFENMFQSLQDEVESLQHSSQVHKNLSTTKLAAVEEENRHLQSRIKLMEEARLDAIASLNADEKLQALIQERKLLVQNLEEAHLQLSDIKSSWSGQNLSLETQVNRLSKQVAEETTEKRKILSENENLKEKVNTLEIDKIKQAEDIKQRDDKIKLLSEEIEELNAVLKECREENEQQIIFERTKSEKLEKEVIDLQMRLNELKTVNQEEVSVLQVQIENLQKELKTALNNMEIEKDEKLTALLRNAEISQREELLKQELRLERNEANELHEKNCTLRAALEAQQQDKLATQNKLKEMSAMQEQYKSELVEKQQLQEQLEEKTINVKVLNQRLVDLKRTLQKELHKTTNGVTAVEYNKTTINCNNCGENVLPTGAIIMDEVNFKYLKHVIVKFLTSREVESRHLIRAVATLLKLTKEEEQLLHDTISWKMSWFGSKPSTGKAQCSHSIQPS